MVRFAVAEPVAVLLLTVPVGIGLAVLAERSLGRIWLGSTPFVVTPQAVASAVVVTLAALVAAFVAVIGVVREPLAASLASVSRRRAASRWGLLAQGALVMLSVAAVVQIVTSEATQSTSFVELLAPLFVALGASVLAMVLIGVIARAWMARTSQRGGLSPFLASRRLVRRQDLVQLVLPLLLATAMATFAASAWKVADDWRVSKAAATIGAATVYYTDTPPSRLQWVTQQADPEGRYLAAAVAPAPRTIDGGRVGLVDATRFARVAAWDSQWGTDGSDEVQGWLTGEMTSDPITFSGEPGAGQDRRDQPGRRAEPAAGDVGALRAVDHRRGARLHARDAAREGLGDPRRLRLGVHRGLHPPTAVHRRQLVVGLRRRRAADHPEHRGRRRRPRRLASRRRDRVACGPALRGVRAATGLPRGRRPRSGHAARPATRPSSG